MTNQWVNSYKRLVSGYEAPIHVCWARNNRSALIRVPVVKHGKWSPPDSSTGRPTGLQPVSGLRGHPGRRTAGDRGGLRAPTRGRRQPLHLSARGAGGQGYRPLPDSLNEAVDEMERSELLLDTLGDHVFEWFIRNKRAEWAGYKSHVTQFELDRYLPLL